MRRGRTRRERRKLRYRRFAALLVRPISPEDGDDEIIAALGGFDLEDDGKGE